MVRRGEPNVRTLGRNGVLADLKTNIDQRADHTERADEFSDTTEFRKGHAGSPGVWVPELLNELS